MSLRSLAVMAPLALLALATQVFASGAIELKGYAGVEARWFTEFEKSQISASGELEAYWESEAGNDSITTKVFARADDTDDERTHADIRELMWLRYSDNWELRAGITKVFWGVTESAHRVDIINQTDGVESPDGEEKLGQPMLYWMGIQDWGTLNAFVMPYFRERTFDGPEGYLGFDLPVDVDNATYQSSDEEKHIDWALRYNHTINVWDFGISHFSGTSREPILNPVVTPDRGVVLVPYYQLMEQTGVDVQATVGQWLWKLEAIYQDNDTQSFSAVTGGFEYTMVGVFESSADLGFLAEYHHNSRGKKAFDPLQDDIFAGARLTFNDIQDTNLLFGIINDLDYSKSYQGFIEGNRRFGDSWVATLDARIFVQEDPADPMQFFGKKDHITFDLAYYF